MQRKGELPTMFETFSRRNRKNREVDAYNYDSLPRPLKVQIIHIWEEVIRHFGGVMVNGHDFVFARIQRDVCEEMGVFELTRNAPSAIEDVCNYFLHEEDIEKCLDVIEIVFSGLVRCVR